MSRNRAIALGVLLLAVLVACVLKQRESSSVVGPVVPHQDERDKGPHADPRDEDTPVLVGTVTRIKDGDTIVVQLSSGPIDVRLGSSDTPEMDQPWGPEAKAALAKRLEHREVALEVLAQDRYDRLVAVVYLGNENLNAWLVQQGHAWAYREYVKDEKYCLWEGDARSARLGLWEAPPKEWHAPWEWRQFKRKDREGFTDYSTETAANCVAALGKRAPPGTKPAPPPQHPGCLIKGNISKSGRIYHLPGSAAYDKTQIDESKGERWFCTEEEARAAGWRAPKG
jgi:endonuclease YncB( thermonuclease family)